VRAFVVTLDGKPVGIGGVSREGGINRAWSEYKPELEPYLKSLTVLRAIKATQRLLMEYPSVVFAEAKHDKGAELMKRMGFTEVNEGFFAWLS